MVVDSTSRETALVFGCEGEDLLGVLHHAAPEAPASAAATAVVLVVGGPQYRVGSHRQFVHLARGFAGAGFVTLRFDYRGMGDSTGARRDFESVSQDIASAIDALQAAQPQIERFVLWGLCDGASAILLYLQDRVDSRIGGVVLANPWVRSNQSLARTRMKHYYLQRLTEKEFWVKFAHGGVGVTALTDAVRNASAAMGRSRPRSIADDPAAVLPRSDRGDTFQSRMAAGLRRFGGRTLLLLSENDYTAKEFIEFASRSAEWKPLLAAGSLSRVHLPDTDHTFSSDDQARRALGCSVEWMNRVLSAAPADAKFGREDKRPLVAQ